MKIGHKLLNRYEIEAVIGEGATATVYRARDLRLGRIVAIKVLSPYVGEAARHRFQREAQSAARLNHPAIMVIYDQAEEDDLHFLVVEYIEGRPLSDFIPASVQVVTDLGSQLCHALDYAHRLNIIHRDIKPANIKVTAEGKVKIMDFGLAMRLGSKHITAHGSIIGTPAYLSPEQARGHDLDHRTDIYSLGVVLYEMATGKLPFDSNDIGAILLQKVTQTPIPPRDLVPGIPPWLDAAIMKALERDPNARIQSGAEFAALLLGGQPTEAAQPAPPGSSIPLHTDKPTEEAPTVREKKKITVIVADDHTILRTSIALFLDDQEDIQVLGEAANGEEVLQLCQQNPPDLLLLDLNMPGKSGLDVLPHIRRMHPKTRVLVLTGRTEDAYIMRALQAGAHGYLLKTSSQEELLECVHKVAAGNMALGTGVAERVVAGALTPGLRDPLTDEERAVLLSIVAGDESNDAIAVRLGCDTQVVVERLMSAIDKLGVATRSEAALAALRAGWISLDEAHQMSNVLKLGS